MFTVFFMASNKRITANGWVTSPSPILIGHADTEADARRMTREAGHMIAGVYNVVFNAELGNHIIFDQA